MILTQILVFLAKNTVISTDFLVWKFCGKANRSKLCGNCAFPQNFHTRKSGEITVFFAVSSTDNAIFIINDFYVGPW